MAQQQHLAAAAALLLLGTLLAGLAAPAGAAEDGPGKRVLVLYGAASIKDTHSAFLRGLEAAGFALDVKSVKDTTLKLKDFDAWLYDSVVLLAPKATSFGGSLSSKALLEFVDAGHNLLLAGASDASDAIRSLALEAGVEFDDKGTALYDHFSHQAGGPPSLVATSNVVVSKAIFGAQQPAAPVLFRGVAATVPASSELVTVALSGEATAYCHDSSKTMPEPQALPVGASAALVTLVQARNNARVLVSGSLDLFSNELWESRVKIAATGKEFPRSGNQAFCMGAALWTLGERGVLRVGKLTHRLVTDAPGAPPPALYRVNDEVEVALDVALVEGGKTTPYEADDLQVSFVMLDPYIRQPLVHDGKGRYSLRFKVPDVYGVFKYVVDYSHRGVSYIAQQAVVPVRPYRHDEYERFLLAAYPYYASVASTMAAFLLLGAAFLYSK